MNKKGQNLLETAIIFTLCAAALIALQFYYKRAMQGKMRSYADEVSGGTALYAPGKMIISNVVTKHTRETGASSKVDPSPLSSGDDEYTVSDSTFSLNQSTRRDEQALRE